ncbi:MAG TPA: DMT family transporter [Polyangiaceae bacterium]
MKTTARELGGLALAACAFATASPIAKSLQGLSFAGIGAGRCAVAAIVLVAIAPAATWRAVAALDGRRRLGLAGAGLLLAAHFGLFLGGLLATSLPAAAALVSLEPVAVVLAAWIAFGVRPTRREAAGIALATVGALIVARGAGTGEHTLTGDALVLGSVVLFGAYVAFARGLRDTMPAMPYAACVYGVAAAALLPFAAVFDGHLGAVPASAWAGVVALGLVPTLVGHTLLQRAARHLSPSLVALASPGETLGAILIGTAMGRVPTAIEWAGAAVVVAGTVVTVTGASTHGDSATSRG